MPASVASERPVIAVEGLKKTFLQGFFRRRVEAVKGVSFEVRAGEIFGFIGPNGSGKTTVIKMLTGLIAPTGGVATLFGEPVPSARARARIGFSPENPYIYPYITPREFVEMCGALSGLRGRELRDLAMSSLERTGVAYAADRPARALSKGMQQRTSIAAAILHDPELLILDEPMSGLDPVGRKEIRDLILEEQARGRTVFLSTHILADVESICERVTVLKRGEVVISGALRDLLGGEVHHTEIVVDALAPEVRAALVAEGVSVSARGVHTLIEVVGGRGAGEVLRRVVEAGAEVVAVQQKRESLEELFMRRAI
ncbi:MAG: ABC transporter ATP-binding protein [Polyangiaceae bacterium]|nr:ABC transporter ATP-binding protein [Polyangiaceae bacterium]